MLKKRIEKLKISDKFNVLSLAILLFLFVSVALSLVFINDVRVGGRSYSEITGYHNYLDSLGKLHLIFESQKDRIYFFRRSQDKEFNVFRVSKISELKQYVSRNSKQLVENNFQGQLARENKKLKKQIEDYFNLLLEVKKYLSSNKKGHGRKYRLLNDHIYKVQKQIYQTKLLTAKAIKVSEGQINSYVHITVGLIFVVFGLAFFSINSMARMIRRQINNSLAYLLEGANKVAHGNFDHIIPIIANDEFGTLAASFNSMTDDLKRTTVHLDALIEEVQRSKKLESQLMYAQSMAALGEMAGGIAHEINNPLAVISANTNVLKMRLELNRVDPEDFTKRIQKIEDTVDRIGRIITGLRTFARDGSRDSYNWEPFQKVMDDTMELCIEKLRSMNIDLRIQQVDPSIQVECSITQLSQVFLNLFNNARDAVAENDERWIEFSFEYKNQQIIARVCDSGEGVDPVILNKIFNPFYTTKAMGHGTGLGLSISKGIIESHGGSIELDTLSENTCFVVTLPARKIEDQNQDPKEIKKSA